MIPATRDDAIAILRAMMTGAQKARSNILEAFGDGDTAGATAEELLARIEPWLWGDKSILKLLIQATGDAESGKPIRGADLMNLIYIATVACPSIVVSSINTHGDTIPTFEDAVGIAAMEW